MIVRDMKLSDISELMPLFVVFHMETLKVYNVSMDSKTVEENITNYIEKYVSFVLEDDEKIVGFIFGVVAPFPLNDNVLMFIESAWFVKKEYRAHSIKLLDRIEQYCKDNKVSRMVVGNTDMGDCERFKKFYERKGFKLFEQHFVKEI
jgi:GNAT superfamily N-acetyltransferase